MMRAGKMDLISPPKKFGSNSHHWVNGTKALRIMFQVSLDRLNDFIKHFKSLP